MKHFIYSLFLLSTIGFLTAKDIAKDDDKIENEINTTIIPEIVLIESSSVPATTIKSEEISVISSTTTTITEENEDHLGGISELQQPGQRRKILYINQQQHGKFNVNLELNDVSLIIIPNKKDPQLSLLNLLLKSAQKSSNLKKDENHQANKTDEENRKLENNHKTTDEYSKYKNDNFMHPSTNIEPYPTVESRVAPYKVDISSTLGLPSPVEIIPNANLMARSPSVKVLKPLIQRFKRSIDTRFYGLNFESPVLSDRSISSDDNEEEELAESITNSLENSDKVNSISNTDGREFILLGAVENCGPGRKRNSYQICVNDNSE